MTTHEFIYGCIIIILIILLTVSNIYQIKKQIKVENKNHQKQMNLYQRLKALQKKYDKLQIEDVNHLEELNKTLKNNIQLKNKIKNK